MASEPWNERSNDSREADTTTLFILFCEDSEVEPIYFKSFGIDGKLRINTNPSYGSSRKHVLNTIQQCLDAGDAICEDGIHKVTTENIWCVFDRDTDQKQPNVKTRDDLEFTSAINYAHNVGLKVAWSNDVFELWVLLHFEQVDANERPSKTDIYDRLTKVFKLLPGLPEDLSNKAIKDNFSYNRAFKNRNDFPLVLQLLKEESRLSAAFERADGLQSEFGKHTFFHDRSPCTMVHHLVRELLAAGAQ